MGAAQVDVTEDDQTKTLELAPVQQLLEETIKAASRELADEEFWKKHTSIEGEKRVKLVNVIEAAAPRIVNVAGRGFIMEDDQ